MTDRTLGEYLKELRKTFGYSQEFVASNLNIIRQTYSHYETGRIVPPTDALFHLAELYKVPLATLLELSTNNTVRLDYNTDINIGGEDNLSVFLEYVNAPQNAQAFKGLTRNEKEMLYYYQHLNNESKEDILDFMKIKYKRTKKITKPKE